MFTIKRPEKTQAVIVPVITRSKRYRQTHLNCIRLQLRRVRDDDLLHVVELVGLVVAVGVVRVTGALSSHFQVQVVEKRF